MERTWAVKYKNDDYAELGISVLKLVSNQVTSFWCEMANFCS